jgi:hypothetical protein
MTNTKEKLRRISREIVLFCFAAGLIMFVYVRATGTGYLPDSQPSWIRDVGPSLFTGFIGGPFLWAVYRFARFLIGR